MEYKNYNDYELVYMVKEDGYYSDILFKKYQPMIFKLSNKYYKEYKNYGYEFDDFYQEALFAFYEALDSYDNSKDTLFYTFVVVCIERSLVSFTRNITSNKNSYLNSNYTEINELDYKIEDTINNTNRIIDLKELETIVKRVIFSLPLEAGAIMELKLNGFTYREIGVLLDIPTSSVEFKTRSARNILRNRVKLYYCK